MLIQMKKMYMNIHSIIWNHPRLEGTHMSMDTEWVSGIFVEGMRWELYSRKAISDPTMVTVCSNVDEWAPVATKWRRGTSPELEKGDHWEQRSQLMGAPSVPGAPTRTSVLPHWLLLHYLAVKTTFLFTSVLRSGSPLNSESSTHFLDGSPLLSQRYLAPQLFVCS